MEHDEKIINNFKDYDLNYSCTDNEENSDSDWLKSDKKCSKTNKEKNR